jgi:hypothetical protein
MSAISSTLNKETVKEYEKRLERKAKCCLHGKLSSEYSFLFWTADVPSSSPTIDQITPGTGSLGNTF